MRGSRNFHERGSNENGNFWSQMRGGPTPKKSRNYLFLGKIFKFQGGSGPPVPPSGSAHVILLMIDCLPPGNWAQTAKVGKAEKEQTEAIERLS